LIGLSSASALPPGPVFSQKHGFRSSPFNLTLSAPERGGSIRFTLDGSEPSATSGTPYQSAIPIRKTSVVRAVWINAQGESSLIETRTYLFLGDIVNQSPTGSPPAGWPKSWGDNEVDYGMDPRITKSEEFKSLIGPALTSLPTLSIVLPLESLFDPFTGIYANSGYKGTEWERHASLELITPSGGDGFCARGGLRIRGGASRDSSNPKHSFRFYFREKYGQERLKYQLFGSTGADSFDKFDLRCDQVGSWHWMGNARNDFIRDQWARNTMLAMGQPADRGHFYHLYLNGVYWGMYNTQEKHDAAYAASYFGGSEEDYDVVKFDNEVASTIETDGTFGSWRRLRDLAAGGLDTMAAYQRIQGNNPDGRRNPAYERLLDVDNLIDYMLLGIYYAPYDTPPSNGHQNNWAAFRSRKNDFGYRFFPHDWEIGLDSYERSVLFRDPYPSMVRDSPASSVNPWHLWEALRPNSEFRLRVADRVQRYFFNGGLLTPVRAAGQYRELMDSISVAVVAESARWGDFAFKDGRRGLEDGFQRPIQPGLLTRADWLNITEKHYLATFFPQRTQVVLNQLRDAKLFPDLQAPMLTPRVGPLLPGQKLTLQHPNSSATIYFTLDGSDPRLPGGSVSPAAQTYSTPFVPPPASFVRARAFLDSEWSPVVEARFRSTRDLSGLRITEIHYHPKAAGGVAEDEAEFLELKNTGSTPVALGGLKFTSGITFEFPAGTTLAPGKFFVLGRNADSFARAYPGLRLTAQYEGQLSNGGEEIQLSDSDGTPLISVEYKTSSPWPHTPDGLGFSLVWSGSGSHEKARNWRPSALLGGSPAADDPAPLLFPKVFLVSACPRTTSGSDTVLLKNEGSQPADVSGWWVGNDTDPVGCRLPEGSLIAPGSILSVSVPLDDRGGRILLCSAALKGALTGYAHLFSYGPCASDDLWQRTVSSAGDEFFSGPNPFGLRINEIHYHPNDLIEFVEIYNSSDSAVDLSLWSLDGLAFTFPEGTSIPAGGFLVVSSVVPESFRTAFSPPVECQVFGPSTTILSNAQQRVRILQPLLIGAETFHRVIESVRYADSAPWPYSADGWGDSLQRILPDSVPSDPASWSAQTPSPGRDNNLNAPPLVSLVSPKPKSKVIMGQPLTLLAEASDPDGTIREVRFFANSEPIGAASAPPFSILWTPSSAKLVDFHAEAEDNQGSIARTAIRTSSIGTPPQSGTGLLARYYPNPDFSGTPVDRQETTLEHDWTDLDPVPGQISRNRFSVRWTGKFLPEVSGQSSFVIAVSGGLRIRVDNHVILDKALGVQNVKAHFPSVAGTPQLLEIEYSTGMISDSTSQPRFLRILYNNTNGNGGGGGNNIGGGGIVDGVGGGGFINIGGGGGVINIGGGGGGFSADGWSIPVSALYLPDTNPLLFAFQTPEQLPNAIRTKFYSVELDTCRGAGAVWFHAESLPQGLSLSDSGLLSGSPEATGVFQIQVSATDENGAVASRAFTLRILPQTPPALPSVTLTSPASNASVTVSPVSMAGKVASPLGISKLEYKLNNQHWRQITLPSGASPAFSVPLDQRRGLRRGANQIQIRALDSALRSSPVLVRQFRHSPQASLRVAIEGQGSVTRGFLGETQRTLGETYRLTATPGRDHLFLGWRDQYGIIRSEQTQFDFVFEYPQTLTAVFTLSPFANASGTYLGFLSSVEPLPQGRGDLTLQINRMGSFTGKIRLGSLALSFRGSFVSDGTCQLLLASGTVHLRLRFVRDAPSFTANVAVQLQEIALETSGVLSRPLQGNPVSQRRNWTVSIPESDSPNTPGQSATAALTLSSQYRARIVGKMADGAAWSMASQLLENFMLPAFTPLYGGGGQFSGAFLLPEDRTSSSAPFLWHRPPQFGTNYPAGFLLTPTVSATLP
jgi:hypothetical protein